MEWRGKGKDTMFIIGKNKKGKLIKFDSSIDCYNAFIEKRIVEWRQIEANNIGEAFKQYNK